MINLYFVSSIRILIDEMNMMMDGWSIEDCKEYANKKYCEADFAIRLGTPFRQLARYPMQGSQGQDILIDYKHFEVEIKYWRNWLDSSRAKVWDQAYQKAFDWLRKEIKNNKKKGERAIICGWFTFFEWKKLLQLGLHSGGDTKHGNTPVNEERLRMLPFLKCGEDRMIRSVHTVYKPHTGKLEIEGSDSVINWELYGEENDKLNVLMLY